MLTDADKKLIEELDAAEKLATPGEWVSHYEGDTRGDVLSRIVDDDPAFEPEIEDILYGYNSDENRDFIMLARNSARPLLALIARLEAENADLRGAMDADDERLRVAAARVGIVAGCDAPDEMADKIEHARAEVARLESKAAMLRRAVDDFFTDCDAAREIAATVLPAADSVGDSYGVPPMQDVVRDLVDRLPAQTSIQADFAAVLADIPQEELDKLPADLASSEIGVVARIKGGDSSVAN